MFSRFIIIYLFALIPPLPARADGEPFQWLNWFESTNSSISGIGTDRSGHIYVVGNYVGSLKIGKRQLPFANTADIYIAQLTRHGKANWVRPLDSGGDDGATRVAFGKSGELFLCGNWGVATASSIG